MIKITYVIALPLPCGNPPQERKIGSGAKKKTNGMLFFCSNCKTIDMRRFWYNPEAAKAYSTKWGENKEQQYQRVVGSLLSFHRIKLIA